jgi:release factor glutamine methyltransferase
VITAIDISEEALKTAIENAELNSCSGIEFIKLDIMSESVNILDPYDVIVSNPPYISKYDFLKLEPELRVYEPGNALSDMSDGYLFYKRIITVSERLLKPGGKIYLEMGAGQSADIKDLLLKNNYKNITITKDYQSIDRVISGEKY